MENDTITALLLAFAVTAAICPFGIPFLHKLKFGQQVRDDGPKAHLKKQGTPTMGGIMILAGFLAGSLPYVGKYPELIPVVFLTLGFGAVGFADDFLKIIKKQSEGLNPKQKLLMQIIITGIFAIYLVRFSRAGAAVEIPFVRTVLTLPAVVFIGLVFLAVLGTDNGTNFTDGVDGLLSSVTLPVAAFLGVLSIREGWNISPSAGAMIGSLMGFLVFNAYPAKVFMGDTGSLAVGGFVSASAFMMRQPLLLPFIGFIYMAEVISVMIQVAYFKKTHGKRFFRMAPIHHHFELGGWSETRVVTIFTIVTALICLAVWIAY